MDLDLLFAALSDPARRHLLDELCERDGQTLFELMGRMILWHGSGLTRQGLSRHLVLLEAAGLIRVEWRWRNKHHFVQTSVIVEAWQRWLKGLAAKAPKEVTHEHHHDQRSGG